jgi:hypothetical protein
MVASFVIPAHIAAPSAVSADPGIMKWDTVSTPNSVVGMNDVLNAHVGPTGLFADIARGSDILDMVAGNDGMTNVFIARAWLDAGTAGIIAGNAAPAQAPGWLAIAGAGGRYQNVLYYSNTSGIADTITRYFALVRHPNFNAGSNLFQVAIAPDDPKVFAVTSDNGVLGTGPRMIWITVDAGQNWDLAFDGVGLEAVETIRDLDISIDYGGKRDIGFCTVNGTLGGRWVVRSSTGFTNWLAQLNANGTAVNALGAVTASGIDYLAIKFSPTYNGDSSVALVYANAAIVGAEPFANATYFNVAFRDLNQNTTLGFAYAFVGIEVKNPASVGGASPNWAQLNNVDLELPSDFSGQSASLRRAYISLDALTFKAAAAVEDGIYRVDDTTTYVLMDTTATVNKAIYSIAYFGTYASGKLLAGERMGFPCTATVPTWFTDSPTTCPIPCWYPALKPTTGAANQGTCGLGAQNGMGGAIVYWNADGSLGEVTTGSLTYTVYAGVLAFGGLGTTGTTGLVPGAFVVSAAGKGNWYQMQYWDAISNDESAFAISRNNGETWNQLSLIDTTIDWFNDVAVAPDCTTIYLASANRNLAPGFCNQFDSVWRSTINPNVAAPLPAVPPLGTYWERVYARVTSGNCTIAQSDLPLLRLVPSCTDKKDGEIVGWAAHLANATATGGGVMAWSPDFGDFWASITPRNIVQDFAFESSTVLYTVSPMALVQRLPYTGTAWSTNLPSYDTTLTMAHTIVAIPEGKVLVGSATGMAYNLGFSSNKGETFSLITVAIPGHGNEHVIYDVDFKNNNFVYMGDDVAGGVLGTVYRNTIPSFGRWVDNDMMSIGNGATGLAWPVLAAASCAAPAGTNPVDPPHPIGIFGLVQAWTGEPQPALYAAHDNLSVYGVATGYNSNGGFGDSAVCRTLQARNGIPKPGVSWDCLDVFAPLCQANVIFTLEPTSLKYCGCCTLDTNTTLYAIDDESGNALRWNAAGLGAAARAGRWNYQTLGFPGYTPALNQGRLWAYTDCLAKKGPILKAPADKYLVGADPVTGRNQQVDLSWEQLCLATAYELQIAKDKDFTLRVNPAVNGPGVIAAVIGGIQLFMDATNMTTPAAWIAPGALPEAGAIYWWRIRVLRSATTQWAWSPWSAARSFTVKAGFIVNTPYYGVQLLSPNNGCLGCKVKPASFSWSPWKEATKYQFDLSKDPEFKQLVVTATTTTTGYEYQGTLDYATNYFWRVKALEVNSLPIPSDWSATFSFQTEPAPAPPPPPPAEPATPLWVWVIIAIGAILVIVTLILIFKTRRV